MSVNSLIFADARAASSACAARILELLAGALESQPFATLAVSGGTTPALMFADMAKARFDWSRVHLFWVDERGVPPTDSQSNYKLTKENFIDPAGFPSANVHRVQGELAAETAAKLYSDEIRKVFGLTGTALPRFDIVHRGMGPDAHTASLFPGEPLIEDRTHIAAAVYVEKFQQWRVTLLPGVLEGARNTLMLAAGADKAEPLRAVLREPYDPLRYPSQLATYNGSGVTWFLDKAAARLVE